jgi:hypothetical protein
MTMLTIRNGAEISSAVMTASLHIEITSPCDISSPQNLKLRIRVFTMRPQPSTSTNKRILNGSEIITGGNMTMPIDIRTLATTISIMINGR